MVGKAIIDDMKGQCVKEYSFRRKNQVVTMDMKSSIKSDGNTVQIDPQLLFQRLALAAKVTHDLESVFKYELCSYPPALFESPFLLHEAQKPALADTIWLLLQAPNIPAVSGQVQYVLDGGHLSIVSHGRREQHTVKFWVPTPSMSPEKNGRAIVVFDGYLNSSTKNMTHQRRLKSKIGATVTFTEKMHLIMTKSELRSTNRDLSTCWVKRWKRITANIIMLLMMPTYSLLKKQ